MKKPRKITQDRFLAEIDKLHGRYLEVIAVTVAEARYGGLSPDPDWTRRAGLSMDDADAVGAAAAKILRDAEAGEDLG